MSARPIASPDDVEISSILEALKKSAPRLVITSLALGALTFAVLSAMAPKYQSQAELAIVGKGASSSFSDSKSTSAGPDSITTKMDKEAINTHVRALQSPDLMIKIVEELALQKKPEFNAALGPVDLVDRIMRLIGIGGVRAGETDRDRVLGQFRNQLEVYSAKESRFIGIRFTSSDAQLASDVANRMAETYRSSLASQGVIEIDDQQKVLQAKIDKLIPEVAAVETEVERYRGEINVFKGGAQNTGLNEQQLSELTGELTKTKAMRGEAEARARSAREMMKLGSADALPDVQKSPLIQNLVQQRVRLERNLSELSASLLPGHPRMQQLNADLAGLKKQLNGEIAKLVDSLDKEAKVAQGREDAIKKSLDDLKVSVVSNAPEEAKLRQMEANAKAKRTELESLQTQIEGNRKKLDTRAQPVEAQLISKAQAASVPVFPKKGPLSALVAVASLLFGTAWTVTRALFVGARSGGSSPPTRVNIAAGGRGRNEPALAAGYDLPIAAKPDAVSETDAQPRPPTVLVTPTTAQENSLPALAARIQAQRLTEGGHRTLVSGETLSINPAAEAIALVKLIAEAGRQVILVDWSPTGHGIAADMKLDRGIGLTELLLGDVNFEDVVKRVPDCRAHFISCGTSLDAAGVDIEPDQLNLVLDALDEAYEHIVVVGAHEDARLLFEAIQGRFDAGVIIADGKKRTSVLEDPAGTFLGFEVTDIDVVRYDRKAMPLATTQQRIMRAIQKPDFEARVT